jgi:hypothetical protein
MRTSSDVRARHLADQIERRSAGRATFDPATRERLAREFKERLDNSASPDRLYGLWERGLDEYVRRAFPGPAHVFVTEEFIVRQFERCADFCPPPR